MNNTNTIYMWYEYNGIWQLWTIQELINDL